MSSEESASSSSSSQERQRASYARRSQPLPGQGGHVPANADPLRSISPPISPIFPGLHEGAPLLSSVAARPTSPPSIGSSSRSPGTSRSRPAVSSPLNPAPFLDREREIVSSSASSKTSHDDRGGGSGDEFYYAPPKLGALSRYSAASSRLSGVDGALLPDLEYHDPGLAPPYQGSFVRPFAETGRPSSASLYSLMTGEDAKANMLKSATTAALLWDEKNAEADDWIHNPIPGERDTSKRRWFSDRGFLNMLGMTIVLGGIICLFMLWPIITYVVNKPPSDLDAFNTGGINSTGQIPVARQLIDNETPKSAYTKTGVDGDTLNLVFSDEFNTEGRTFWPGDDPFWEAVSLNYWATDNYEWLDPDAVVTKGGNLEITISEQPTRGFSFRSGMIQSWNKFCWNDNAHIEVNVSLPGTPNCQGLWPAAWTMGNLARAGYGATNEGMWPYSYDACDVGTEPNQTNTDGRTPPAAKSSGSHDYGGELSWLPGQRASACTCPGEDHPGPDVSVGRSGPEIDILEAQVDYHGYGTASQSLQLAPFDAGYAWQNNSVGMFITNTTRTILNQYKGSITQEAASGVSMLDAVSYGGVQYQTFAYEYQGGSDGKITWLVNDQPTWGVYAAAFGPNSETEVSQRLIPVEPMYAILNLGLSPKFQTVQFGCLQFPTTMMIDYIRIYQKGSGNVGCDPSDHPTADYIQNHLEAYMNANRTTWAQAGYQWPRNSRVHSCS